MKIYKATWPELSQKRTLDKRGAKRRLISYEHIRSAKSKDARVVLKEYGLLKTPKAEAIENYREGYDKIDWR